MEDKKQIDFKLVGINTTEFAIFEDNHVKNGEHKIATQLDFGHSKKDKKMVAVNVRFTFENDNKPILRLGVVCVFHMLQWEDYFNLENNSLLLPKYFAQHITVITIGTARGILHAKTEGSMLNYIILPAINVLDLVTSDVTITAN